MRAAMNFENTARLGYVLLALLLGSGMAYAVHRSYIDTDEQIDALRAEENAITLVERLRWSSELLLSAGRGYLLSGEPKLFTDVQIDRSRFDDQVRTLRTQSLTPFEHDLVTAVQQTAASLTQV